ncbi:sulfur carrier protein ThiS adenylyltransferase ThiF [Desulfotignum phosphitoxidans]|uniref:Thiamine biosynthesis protein ThiF n=1 Tax=Desulfotignum phosphitoxidans DSM 13687 TaxID=1286635 RepID=S0G7U8_9BACT|nr:sulfur carrier protein ThiS adenylyltransferase ThiF [Desulfotignum phosphitoxidans]EMS81497.1 thiamine biosynthesis protein ThiF [Desulfotignum phosphitoxidans DSM 13687]
MKVGIAGVGGIGSNVARHLAQTGVKTLVIADFDCVEVSNLNRQFYRTDQASLKKTDCLKDNLLAINPDMEIETVDMKIGPGDAAHIFRDCDVVVEGFDQKQLKKMLIEEMSDTGKMMVSASGIAGWDLTSVTTKKIGSCQVVGDFVSDQGDHALFPPKIALVAAHMASIVLKYAKE